MPRSLDIFVKTDADIDELAAELEVLSPIKFDHRIEGDEVTYETLTDHLTVLLFEHMLEDDRDMRFTDYRYQISIIPHNLGTEEQRQQWQTELAERLYEGLKAMKKYRLMMVDDVQTKLREDSP
jgi:hypothetical protein